MSSAAPTPKEKKINATTAAYCATVDTSCPVLRTKGQKIVSMQTAIEVENQSRLT